MIVRFFIDPDTLLPHIEQHNVAEREVLEVLRGPANHFPGREGTRTAEGQTAAGRFLRVIFKENEIDGSLFVITAYELNRKSKVAFRRRKRRRS